MSLMATGFLSQAANLVFSALKLKEDMEMCTNFKITTTNADIVVGRSQEFSQMLGRSLVFRKAGHHFTQNLFDPSNKDCLPSQWAEENCRFEWTGDYGFVAMNSVDFAEVASTHKLHIAESMTSPIGTDGINTEGLYIGSLLQNAANYPTVTDPKKGLSVTNFVDYILSTCKTVEDVKEKLLGKEDNQWTCSNEKHNAPEVQVTDSTRKKLFHQHFPVHDRFGNSIVIEFLNGEVKIHDNNEYGVLTNDPDFEWHITNLSNFAGIQPTSIHQTEKGNLAPIEMKSQGGGFALLPGSPLPMHRFVRAVMMVNYAEPVDCIDKGVNQAAHILNTVDIPIGVIRDINEEEPLKPELDYTQYITISDLSQRKFYVRLYESPQVYSVDLDKLDLVALNGKTYDIPRSPLSNNLTAQIN